MKVTHLVFKNYRISWHKVNIDVPGPVANNHHQTEDEEEDEEVWRLGIGSIKET